MLTQIKKIKNFGVFDNYAASKDLSVFGRYNIVYGENGSGKTTLSRLIACLEDGAHTDHPNLEYLIESASGNFNQGSKYPRRVRVFNSDYIEANIGRLDGPLRHILILGEENKAIAEELKVEIVTRDTRNKQILDNTTLITKLDNDKGKLFSQIAKTIGEATSGSTLRSYRKPDAETKYTKLITEDSLSAQELESHRITVRQEQMGKISALEIPIIATESGDKSVITLAGESSAKTNSLAARTAQSATVARLVENPDISEWVDIGMHIHKTHASDSCEFCQQKLPVQRLQELADHFSIEDQNLKEDLEQERVLLNNVIAGLDKINFPDRMAFYAEFRDQYLSAVGKLSSQFSKLKLDLEALDEALLEKIAQRTISYDLNLSSNIDDVQKTLEAINALINAHNKKSDGFEKAKEIAREAIEIHYLLSIKTQVDGFLSQIYSLAVENKLLNEGGEALKDKRSLAELNSSITEKQAKVSNSHAGGENLTKHLKQFLGRTDLRFESGPDGYTVLRRGKPANKLSEGEKTAIAFLYFLVQLKDKDFDLTEGIVVIDDPISSLDASAIYQAFSFLKNETVNAKQLFLLTHNFEFLRLLINWLQNLPGKIDKSYSMVLCSESESGRFARLLPLDRLLIDHATEYQYLFKVLYTFKSDGTILSSYHVPNVARKVLETFLDFYTPSNKSLYQKLETVQFDAHKKQQF